jgi:hypothetical protein
MSKKSETIRIGLLTALIAFAAIAAFAIVMSPSGVITTPAHALRQTGSNDSHHGPGSCGCGSNGDNT